MRRIYPFKRKAVALGPMTSVPRTSVQYIQISDTHTTPYISMNALERMPVRSINAPNIIGSTKPPRPPARPTIPEMTPMLCGYSSAMYLNTDALPNAHVMPSTKSSKVTNQTLSPMWNVFGPSTERIVKSVCEYESRNRQIQLTHITHQVSACAPTLSDSHPPA